MQASAFQWLMSRHDLAVEASRRFTRPQLEGLAVDQRLTPLYSSYLFTALFPLLALWKLLHPPRVKPGAPVKNDIKMPPSGQHPPLRDLPLGVPVDSLSPASLWNFRLSSGQKTNPNIVGYDHYMGTKLLAWK